MPTASAAYSRGSSYGTTYGSSFSTTTVPRSNSASRRSSLSNGYTSGSSNGYVSGGSSSSNATSQYKASRTLPPGPGPLDYRGRKIDSFTSSSNSVGLDTAATRRARASPVGAGLSSVSSRSGPLRADHSTGSYVHRYGDRGLGVVDPHRDRSGIDIYHRDRDRTSDYLSGTSTLNRKHSPGGLDPLLSSPVGNGVGGGGGGSRLSGRRSASLANLRLDEEPLPALNSRSHHYDSSDQHRPSSRRGSRAGINDSDFLGNTSSPRVSGRTLTSGQEKELGGRSRYTPSVSRESSPGPSNGHSGGGGASRTGGRAYVGDRDRDGSVVREEPPRSKSSSLSSSSTSSSAVNGKSSGSHRDGGKVGLRNLGNTCFMNSVLQCLSNTKPLIEWLLNEGYLLEMNTTTSSMKGALIKSFAALMKSLWKESGSETYVSPNAFKTQIQKFSPRFMGYSQQDSQEFLRYLLEGIHEDVNRVTQKPKPVILDDNRLDSKNDRDKAKEYWNAYLTRDNSHIVDMFVGQLKSELKFAECGHRSVTFDPFWDLSLPIPKNKSELSLDDCLRMFMKEEELEAEERPMCTKCKARRSCTKSFSIHRFPQILVIHLKRFSQERYGRKLSALVDFPVKGLTLTDYSSEKGGQKVAYDLYAVSDHSGGVHSGHYTAICKNPYSTDWNVYNDTRVSSGRSNQCVSSEAYVLFYELTSPAGRL